MHSVNPKASRQCLASALVLCLKGYGLGRITDWVETLEMYLPFHTCACRDCYQVLFLMALRKAALRDPVTLQGFARAKRLCVGTGCHASSPDLPSLWVCLSRAALSASHSSDTCSTLCFQMFRLLLLSRSDCIRQMLSICWAILCSSPNLLCSWLARPADCP